MKNKIICVVIILIYSLQAFSQKAGTVTVEAPHESGHQRVDSEGHYHDGSDGHGSDWGSGMGGRGNGGGNGSGFSGSMGGGTGFGGGTAGGGGGAGRSGGGGGGSGSPGSGPGGATDHPGRDVFTGKDHPQRDGGPSYEKNSDRARYYALLRQESEALEDEGTEVQNSLSKITESNDSSLAATDFADPPLNMAQTSSRVVRTPIKFEESLHQLLASRVGTDAELLEAQGVIPYGAGSGSFVVTSPPGAFRDKIIDLKSKYEKAHPKTPQGRIAKRIGMVATEKADEEYTARNEKLAEAYYNIGLSFLDVTLGLIPVVGSIKAAYEAISGTSIVTGDKLSTGARILSGVAALTMGLTSDLQTGAKVLRELEQLAFPAESAIAKNLATETEKLLAHLENFTFHSGDELNAALVALNREPSYLAGSVVARATIKKSGMSFMRAYAKGGKIDSIWATTENIETMTAAEIRERYAVGTAVDAIASVTPVEKSWIEISIAGENKWGHGGGLQIKFDPSELNPSWFSHLKDIGGK